MPRLLYVGRCSPAAAHPYACGAQRALLPVAVGAMNINELMNINDVRESATIFPRPCKLTFELLTLKVVSESRVTWATCVPILVFHLYSRYSRCTRQTVRRQTKSLLNAPAYWCGGIKINTNLLVVLVVPQFWHVNL